MNKLVFNNSNGETITTSLIVASVFEKEHNKVCRDIQNLSCSQSFRAANFGVSSYISRQNKELPMYEMSKNGFIFVVMGYTGDKAGEFKENFIKEFDKRDLMLKNDDFIISKAMNILYKRTKSLEYKFEKKDTPIAWQREIINNEYPNQMYYPGENNIDRIMPISFIAEELGISARALNLKLQEAGVQSKDLDRWTLNPKYANKGLVRTRTRWDYGVPTMRREVIAEWTELGRRMIHSLFPSSQIQTIPIKNDENYLDLDDGSNFKFN